MSRHPEIYVSTDIEADGPVPGAYSMLSFGSAAYRANKTLVATFSANLDTLPGAAEHPKTMAWWENFPQAWAACRADTEPAEVVMPRYLEWLQSLPGKPVFVGYPAAFDFMFVAWYLLSYTGENPFGFAALDIKSYAMALLDTPFKETVKDRMPAEWFDDMPHTHIALDDALEQGAMFCNILAARDTDWEN
jgi:hypothetical protein